MRALCSVCGSSHVTSLRLPSTFTLSLSHFHRRSHSCCAFQLGFLPGKQFHAPLLLLSALLAPWAAETGLTCHPVPYPLCESLLSTQFRTAVHSDLRGQKWHCNLVDSKVFQLLLHFSSCAQDCSAFLMPLLQIYAQASPSQGQSGVGRIFLSGRRPSP